MARASGGSDSDRRGASRRGSGGEDRDGRRVEGIHAVEHLLKAGRRRVQRVSLAAAAARGGSRAGALGRLKHLAEAAGVAVDERPAAEISAMAATAAPQGVVARAEPLRFISVADAGRRWLGGAKLAGAAGGDVGASPAPFAVAVDGVADPQNLGAILRSAEVFGAAGAVLAAHKAAPLSAAALKAAAGAVEYLDLVRAESLPAALAALKKAGFWLAGLDSAGEPIAGVAVIGEPLVLVIGAEGRGLSPLVRKRVDVLVSIQMAGRVESLNASAAAAVACHEAARMRKGGGG